MRNVRIENISITNFKNVKYGTIDLVTKKEFKGNILGLYGQNGSGKTALIDSISLLKSIMSGQKVQNSFADLVNIDSNNASFEFRFSLTNDSDIAYALYSFSLKKVYSDNDDSHIKNYFSAIYDEKLSISRYVDNKNVLAKQLLIDTTNSETFGPKTKYELLLNNFKETEIDVIVAKKLAYKSGRSFIFSNELLKLVNEKCTDDFILEILNTLKQYAKTNLFILSNKSSALINFDTLPIFFRIEEKGLNAAGAIGIPIESYGMIPYSTLKIVEKVISNMNIVLPQLVPGLIISLKNLGEEINANGQKIVKVQLFSNKNSKEIPLKYESDGIKKIVTMLQLLIVIYNNSSVTVAIDELDSGVFEYLLGEILRIIYDNGKGQLIFTSHNLRPLETLNKAFVAFTTTNPQNRYIRFINLKPKNNLRDYYYRDIILGEEQAEDVYEKTNNRMISFAFKEAGKINE